MRNENLEKLYTLYSPCVLCPRACRAQRHRGEVGECGAGKEVFVASYHLHFGEEPPISGYRGSGTVFFSGCNLHCLFCQNYDISHSLTGVSLTPKQLALVFLELQDKGAHNINLVTPTHYAPFLAHAIILAREQGLNIPIVYNCGGYESVAVIKHLEPYVDIYMPDAKIADPFWAKRLLKAENYPKVNRKVLQEMYRQKGPLIFQGQGVALRGVLIRHLVMPNNIARTEEVLKMIHEVAPRAYVSLMRQYRPCYRAFEVPDIGRGITTKEFDEAVQWFYRYQLQGYIQ